MPEVTAAQRAAWRALAERLYAARRSPISLTTTARDWWTCAETVPILLAALEASEARAPADPEEG